MRCRLNDKGATIMIHTHQTAPTQFVEANSIRFAYRRFGKTGGVPLVFSQHYIGTMDYWDPTVTDGLARDRGVVLFDNAGVSSSSGEVPTTFEQMGANAIAFIKALGLKQVDLFGFSIGGMVVQEITLQAPDLVRRLIVDGAGPRGGQGMELIAQATGRLFGAHPHDPPESVWLAVKFSPSAAGQAAGRAFLKRTHLRQEGRDPEVNDKVSPAQVEAIRNWGVQQEGANDYLKTIKQPTLVVNGSDDVNIPTVNSFIMQQNMPYAQLIIYPDSNHGAHHMAVQSENERNKAVVDEYFKAGVQGHLTSFAAYLHPDFTVTAPNYLPWGGRHVGAAFFRDHLLPGVTDVFDFAARI